jgi:hypothetical protein
MNKILTVGVTLALLLGTVVSPACAGSGGAGGAGGHGGGGHGHGGHGHGGDGHGGHIGFHADRFERRFFESGLGLGVLDSALLIAPEVYYASPVYYVPLPTPCNSPYPPNNYPPQGYNPPQGWLEQPCQ